MVHFDDQENARLHSELAEHITHLIEAGLIQDPIALGISKRVQDKGLDALSKKQDWVFKKQVYDPYCQPTCWRCGDSIPIGEAWDVEAGDLNDLCSSCRHDWNRMN